MAMMVRLRKRGLGQEMLKKEKRWKDDRKKEESNGLQTLSQVTQWVVLLLTKIWDTGTEVG